MTWRGYRGCGPHGGEDWREVGQPARSATASPMLPLAQFLAPNPLPGGFADRRQSVFRSTLEPVDTGSFAEPVRTAGGRFRRRTMIAMIPAITSRAISPVMT